MSQPLLIDTDGDSQDLLALALAACSSDLDLLGVTTVAGSLGVRRAAQNALQLLAAAGKPQVPVYEGAGQPVPAQAARLAGQGDDPFLGANGFGDRVLPARRGAVEFMVETVRGRPGEVALVALGPLTNVAQALRRDHNFAADLQRLIIVGGAYGVPGNVTPGAEFNMWSDPDAASEVLAALSGAWLIGLDVAREVRLSRRAVERSLALRADGRSASLAAAIDRCMPAQQGRKGFDGCYVHGALGVAAAAKSDCLRCVPARVEVQTGASEGRGASLVLRWGAQSWKPGVHRVARQVRTAACLRWILSRIGARARGAGGHSASAHEAGY